MAVVVHATSVANVEAAVTAASTNRLLLIVSCFDALAIAVAIIVARCKDVTVGVTATNQIGDIMIDAFMIEQVDYNISGSSPYRSAASRSSR